MDSIAEQELDLAWLAGIIDGEGCFSVKRPVYRKSGERSGSRTSYQLWLVLCNTFEAMVARAVRILDAHGIVHSKVRKVWKGKKATRFQYWVDVIRKQDLLQITRLILPHLTAKRTEAELVVWFLNRAVQRAQHHATPLEKLVLESMSRIKRNGGEAPEELRELLSEVIPSQADSGLAKATGQREVESEGVETRQMSPNNNSAHECPAPH